MYLSTPEVERFYRIWYFLLHYVNQQRKLAPSFPKVWGSGPVPLELAVPIREALWEDDSLRETYIAENPDGLSVADLALIDSWQHRVAGNFFVFRHLKKYSILIGGETESQGFGVLGITEPIEDVIGPHLPIYVKTTLLPFEDRIIYDSLLSSYSIYFGGGIRRSLKNTYRDIQERGGLITSLPLDETTTLKKCQASNKKVLTAYQKALGKSGLSPKMMEQHTANLAAFSEDLLLKQTPPGLLLDITQQSVAAYQDARTKKLNAVSFKRFVRFLRDTERMDWYEAEDLLDYLKQL